jgi:hypothetical protein
MTLKRYQINEALTWAGFVLLFITAVLIARQGWTSGCGN